MKNQNKNIYRNSLEGFTLIELLMVIGVIAILAITALPNYIRTQQMQRLNSANLTFETGITALRNMALAGFEIDNKIPDGYCIRYISGTGTLEAFSYIDVNNDDKYSGTTGSPNDDEEKHVLTNDPIELPNLSATGQFSGVDVSKILIEPRGGTIIDNTAKEPILCFLPPKAKPMIVYANDSYSVAGSARIIYELSTEAANGEVYNVIVDSVTGSIRASNGLTTTLEPAP